MKPKVKDAAANWRARLAALPADQSDRITVTLLALMRARTAKNAVLESSTRFSRGEKADDGGC
jgi:hypothetical protein